MELFRLTRKKYSKSLSGIGAAKNGARWNSKGVEVIYTAANRSLAMAEVSVHFTMATLPDDYQMITIFVPDDISTKQINSNKLPKNWNVFPHIKATKKIGDQFISEGKFCCLKVPSAVTSGDFNFLINPSHKSFSKIKIIKIEPFPFDKRIFK